MGLSGEGRDLKALCDRMSGSVASAIGDMVGRQASGRVFRERGADGTPTKVIDKAAEDAALQPLQIHASRFRVLSEEMGQKDLGGRPEEEPQYLLKLDPLDGTFNAISGIPFYAVSIFISSEGVAFGYVCDLARSIRYYAEDGRDAFCEEASGVVRTVNVSDTSDLKGFSISAYTIRPLTSRIVGVGDRVRRIRTLGSASLELCYVADGRLDAFVDLRSRTRVVDVAAGVLIVKEAGGTVSDCTGAPVKIDNDMWEPTDLIASNGLLHGDLLSLIGGGPH